MDVTSSYWLTRFVFQRALGITYLIAFLVVVHQWIPLLGERGLLPVPQFVKQIPFWRSPSIFFFLPKDWAFLVFGWLGVALSILTILGISERFGLVVSMTIWGLLWFLYLSFVNVGQTWYSFGWESMLLETGFLAIFLGSANTKVPILVIFLLRWVLFRNMFGAGLIKIRGDPCWRDWTCLTYHYETNPIPNPLSWYFHWMPTWFNKLGVGVNHFTELIVPIAYFFPQPMATAAGAATIGFMGMIMASGNFAFLNFLTIVLALSTLDGSLLARILPIAVPASLIALPFHNYAVYGLTGLVGLLSIQPLLNLISPRQIMNTSFDPLHLVNTYGAFGSITKERYEIIIEGAMNDSPRFGEAGEPTNESPWRSYEFFGKPGDVTRRSPQIAPYHLRLDWLMWFAAFSPTARDPWFVHLLAKLLDGDKATLSLMKVNPFPDHPPRFIRARYYRYHFTTPEERKQTGAWWTRELVGDYFPAVSRDDPDLQAILKRFGWETR